MSTLIDARFEKLRSLGYTGTTSDMLYDWLIAEGADAGNGHINDKWHQMLVSKGYSGQVNDMWYAYLGFLGYTGHINDREKVFWENL